MNCPNLENLKLGKFWERCEIAYLSIENFKYFRNCHFPQWDWKQKNFKTYNQTNEEMKWRIFSKRRKMPFQSILNLLLTHGRWSLLKSIVRIYYESTEFLKLRNISWKKFDWNRNTPIQNSKKIDCISQRFLTEMASLKIKSMLRWLCWAWIHEQSRKVMVIAQMQKSCQGFSALSWRRRQH